MNLLLIKSILRGYLRNGTFSFLNLVSLTLVMVVSYLGLCYLLFEYSYDSQHEKSASLYRVVFNYREQAYSIVGFPSQTTPGLNEQLAYVNALRESHGVEAVCQFITQPYTEYVQTTEKQIPQDGFLTTNTPGDFVAMFTWRPTLGSLTDFAQGGNRILLTEAVARKLYGDAYDTRSDVVGSDIRVGGITYVLAAVVEDAPRNSHFEFAVALSTDRLNYWGSRLYVEKSQNVSAEHLKKSINQAIAAVNPRLARDELYQGHTVQNIGSIHLANPLLYEAKQPGNGRYILLVATFTAFILVLGAFNYSTISTAIYSKNEKSFGVKRIVGASSRDVSFQLWLNGIILSLMCMVPTVVVLSLIVPGFNQLMGVSLPFHPFRDGPMLLILLVLALAAGSLASLGPIVMVSHKPVLGFFRNIHPIRTVWHMPLRNQLVVGQFIVLIVISSLSYVVLTQLAFVASTNVGYQTKNIVYAYTSETNMAAFQRALRSMPGIAHVGNGSSFGTESFNTTTYRLEGTDEIFDDARDLYIDTAALKAYGLTTTLLAPPATRVTLISRTAADKLAQVKGTTAEALIGSVVITEPEYVNPETGQVGVPFTIGGIFEDIHLFSLHQKVEPYFLTVIPSLRMDGRTIIALENELTGTMEDDIRQAYNKLGELFPLQIELLQNNVERLYQQDRQFGTLLFYLNIIALAISGIGVIGITLFALRTRIKEIGIRKVLGADAVDLIKLMSKGYMPLILISLAVAWPLAYFLAQGWLQEFAYRIPLSQWIFPAMALLSLFFTLALIIAITRAAARANPVDSIRNE